MKSDNPIFPSFGPLLRHFRKREHVTQQQLAEVLGVHRSTLIHWEQGNFLPQSKALVLELARHMHLNDQETRELLEASLTALTPHWMVPLPRNPFFTGRAGTLNALHEQLRAEQAVALTPSPALHGLGGVGKTQIALEYAYQYALEYSAVFWIEAETEEQIIASLLRIAETLQLSRHTDKDQQRVIAAVQRWLSTHGQWLLIWDNVEDLALLRHFLPTARPGALLLTTRRQALGTLARSLRLLPMEQEEGRLFLLRRAKMLAPEATSEQIQQFTIQSPAQDAAVAELVTLLGGLPLALDQAGAYIEETKCGLPAYLDLFRTRRDALLQRRGEGIQDHPDSVSTTFRLAIAAAVEYHPAVRELLQGCAFLLPDGIPEELFRQGHAHVGTLLSAACGDQMEWDHLVSIASSYSLLSRQPEAHMLSLHRLVQVVLLDTMSEQEQTQGKIRVIEALNVVFPEIRLTAEYAQRKQCDRLLPHALHGLRQMGPRAGSLTVASLAYKAALALHVHAQYAEAERLHLSALRIREQALGLEHPDVASSLHALALLFWKQGRDREAEPLYLRALQIRELVLGANHPDVASVLNDLGNLSWKQGKYAEAESFSLRALRIREQVLGADHPEVAYSLNNLSMIYGEQGRYTEVEQLSLRALQIREQALGPDHPDVAISLHNLGNLYREQGRYAEAERLCLRELHIFEQAQGSNHPDVAYPLHNLAELYREQGKHAEAEPLYVRALQIWEQTLGADHSLVAHPLQNLADLYRTQGRVREAEAYYRRALSIREKQLDAQHPETAESLYGLALLRQQQGYVNEALACAERALTIRSQSLGESHTKTVAAREFHTQLLQEQARTGSASPSVRLLLVPRENEHSEVGALSPFQETASQDTSLQEFLDACCELHPLAWCRISDLWPTYEQWIATSQRRLPLSRRTFAEQIKARGCRVARTSSARIWRGIRLLRDTP